MSVAPAHELIGHLRDATLQTAAYIDGMTKSDFVADKRTQQAAILNLIIIGESATKMMDRYPDFVAAHPEVDWRAMRGMRNRIAHGYYEIDLEVVWETVSSALPKLAKLLRDFP